MPKILIVYSTIDGHTYTISRHLAKLLEAGNNQVQLVPVDQLCVAALDDCDKVVIGASIRYGHYRPELVSLVRQQADKLDAKPSAFFTVNLVARKPGRDSPETNPYVHRLLDQTTWQPREIAVFAGKLDYAHYRFLDRWVIRLIMKLTGGPTNFDTVQDFTDWAKVEMFASRVAQI